MKLLTDTAWFEALKSWFGRRRRSHEPADMGTAFGLDSITVIDFEPTVAGESRTPVATSDWQRRVTRRSRL